MSDQGDGKAEDGIVMLMKRSASPAVVDYNENQRDACGIYNIEPNGHSLDLCVRKGNVEVVGVEHAMKGFDEEHQGQVCCQKSAES
ncbi:hypothetical protein RRF57_002237 [Xylaria bambusicola]|uniref:Uncharacterized protein n=1 Tax=Xylaria bambusicola TaxID=326684 RepID=A0AAN7Z1M2_9PEZI